MFKRNFFVAIAMLIIGVISAYAETSPFQMLRFNKSARAAGIGGCFEAMPNDAAAVFVNPATISTVDDKNFSLTFFKHVLDINSGIVSYVRHYEDMGTFAASVNFTNYGSFDYADYYGNQDGRSFSGNDMSMGLSYSNELDTNLYYGATFKLIFMTLEEINSLAFAIDAGMMYRLSDNRTNIGLSILHVGSQLTKFTDYTEDLPMDLRLGINHNLEGLPLLVNLSFHHLADHSEDGFFARFLNFSVAGELRLGKYLELRLGYDNKLRRETTPESDRKLSGLSSGLGIKLADLNFDYAIAQVGAAAIWHRFGLSLNL